jgi:hypothetical protein
MTKVIFGLLTLTALLLFPVASRAQNAKPSPPATAATENPFLRIFGNGVWWTSLSHDRKFDFIDGYLAAMADVHRTVAYLLADETKKLSAGDPQFDARMHGLIAMATLSERYDYGEDRIRLLNGVDEFYKDPLNTRIGVEFAMQFVRDTQNGEHAPNDLAKQLSEWRAVVNK